MSQLTVSIKIYAPIARVREVFTTPDYIIQRNHASDDRHCPAATNDLRVGWLFSSTMAAKDGSFSFDFTGQYDLVEPMHRIEYTMGEFKEHFVPAGRKCTVIFEEDGSCGCVTLTETFDAEDTHNAEQQIEGWQAILENCKAVCEAK